MFKDCNTTTLLITSNPGGYEAVTVRPFASYLKPLFQRPRPHVSPQIFLCSGRLEYLRKRTGLDLVTLVEKSLCLVPVVPSSNGFNRVNVSVLYVISQHYIEWGCGAGGGIQKKRKLSFFRIKMGYC